MDPTRYRIVPADPHAHVAAQLRYPQRIVAIVVVREGDETIETAPV